MVNGASHRVTSQSDPLDAATFRGDVPETSTISGVPLDSMRRTAGTTIALRHAMMTTMRSLLCTTPVMAAITIAVAAVACKGSDDAVPPAAVPAGDDASAPVTDAAPETGTTADAGDADAASPGAFVSVGSAPESCPLAPAACGGWPDAATEGVVTKHTSRETFGARSFDRTFHVFVPKAVVAASPLVIMLHGGNGSAVRSLVTQPWTAIAQAPAAGEIWRPNGPLCKALPTSEANGLVYQTAGGADCMPPEKTALNARPFVVVYPDGVADPGTTELRHWEDGRVPSPGFGTLVPNRDDVGFLDHVIAVLLADKTLKVDPTNVYLVGVSNGGMMTQRVASEIAKPAYPNLRRVAAFAAFVSDLPAPLKPLAGATVPFGLALFHGTDIEQPDCNTPGCTAPTVLGDGRMPFGAPGGVHYVNSPDSGRVLSGPDTIAAWRASLGAAAGAAPIAAIADVGYFSKKETTTYGSSPVEFESWVTTGGGHSFQSSREDFLPVSRAWAFVSSFKRDAAGVLTRQTPSWSTGDY
jgi:poly(3-hydroxybutyrate) depolymerase